MSDENEPAFPMPHYTRPDGDIVWGSPGLTKRELFAAMALQGLLSAPNQIGSPQRCATDAAELADALLAELAK